MPPSTSQYGILDPHPSVVATKLLARKRFIDNGDQFNVIACSWIQFMIHDWVDHLEDTHQVLIFSNLTPLILKIYSSFPQL
jgi:hypothetical protein